MYYLLISLFYTIARIPVRENPCRILSLVKVGLHVISSDDETRAIIRGKSYFYHSLESFRRWVIVNFHDAEVYLNLHRRNPLPSIFPSHINSLLMSSQYPRCYFSMRMCWFWRKFADDIGILERKRIYEKIFVFLCWSVYAHTSIQCKCIHRYRHRVINI